MPTYDYVCGDCGHRFEEFQSMSADALSDCPSCGEPRLQRLIGTGAGLLFKGSGFYLTDYKKSGSSSTASDSPSSSAPSESPASKSDAAAESSAPKKATTDTSGSTAKA